MITTENCIIKVLQTFPAFQSHWENYIQSWEYQTPGICFDLTTFGDYVVNVLKDKQTLDSNVQVIFDFIETLLTEGDNEVQDATTTCLLENIVNSTGVETKRFIPYLGKLSKQYIKAWDEFTGVKTEGLWKE